MSKIEANFMEHLKPLLPAGGDASELEAVAQALAGLSPEDRDLLAAVQESSYRLTTLEQFREFPANTEYFILEPNISKVEDVGWRYLAQHNVRFQFIKWRNSITLGEMMVSEGLAENFATHLYGEDKAGPWVTKTDMQTLNEYIKPIIHDGLNVQGLENLNAYLYGDEMAAMQNFPCVGLPYCAGYACGYHLVKRYLKKTGKSIIEATLLPASEILETVEDFWNE